MDPSSPEIKRLTEAIEFAKKTSPADLVGAERLGELSFTEIEPEIQQSLQLLSELDELDPNGLPSARFKAISNVANHVRSQFNELVGFSAHHADALNMRRNLIKNVSEAYNQLFSEAAPILGYIRSSSGTFERLEAAAATHRETLQQQTAAASEKVKEMEAEASRALEGIRQLAADAGVSQHARHFADQAAEHRSAGNRWLVATLLMALATLGATVGLAFYQLSIPPTMSAAVAVQLSLVSSCPGVCKL